MGFRNKRPRCTYSNEILNKAIAAVNAGLTVNEASRKFRIPRSSLYIKVSSKCDISRTKNSTLLCLDDELKLKKWLDYMLTLGRKVTKDHVINSATILSRKSRNNQFDDGVRPGDFWCKCFYRRYEGLKKRMREVSWKAQFEPTTTSLIKWFKRVEQQLHDEDLIDVDGFRVFNVGEISLPLNPNHDGANNEDNQNGTMLITGNAAGQLAPAMILFGSDHLADDEIHSKLPADWSVKTATEAWMTVELFTEYIREVFYPWLVERNTVFPVLLFVDSHVEYFTHSLSEFLESRRIVVSVLPSNSTMFFQPLEISLFSYIRRYWIKIVDIFKLENRMSRVRKIDFVLLLKELFDTIDTIEILGKGFKKTGLYPLSRGAVDDMGVKSGNKEAKEKSDSAKTATLLQTIEKFIDPPTLSEFRFSLGLNKWSGKTEDESLFYFWRRIYKKEQLTACHEAKEQLQSKKIDDSSIGMKLNYNTVNLLSDNQDQSQSQVTNLMEIDSGVDTWHSERIDSLIESCDIEEMITPINLIVIRPEEEEEETIPIDSSEWDAELFECD